VRRAVQCCAVLCRLAVFYSGCAALRCAGIMCFCRVGTGEATNEGRVEGSEKFQQQQQREGTIVDLSRRDWNPTCASDGKS